MRYLSVKRQSPPVSFREALFAGLAPDGGLYVPESLPTLPADLLCRLPELDFHEIGLPVLTPFLGDPAPGIPADDLRRILQEAWDFPIPLTRLDDDVHLLELFHGPTLAFKDVGARFMARAMSYYLDPAAAAPRIDPALAGVTILAATSGDTGSAVAHGFFGVPHTRVVVLYPSGQISPLQEKQMTTLGGNIEALEVEGTFDDCQTLVKQALSDAEIRAALSVTTANSINLGRLLPQAVYYVWAVAQWVGTGRHGDPSIVVPSGNFGNVTALAYARRMGLPVRRCAVAVNANDVVPDFYRSGILAPRPSIRTPSSAMDVGNPGNLARLLDLFEHDVADLARSLPAESVSDAETLATIRSSFDASGVVLDPHTAVGVAAARRFIARDPSFGPVIVAATAHPGKFPEVIGQALGTPPPPPPALVRLLEKSGRSTKLPARLEEFRRYLLELKTP